MPLINGHALSRALGALGLRADVRRLQPRLLSDAHHRPARHAAARLHLRTPTWAGTCWNLLSSIGAFVLAAGVRCSSSTRCAPGCGRERPHGNPWRAARSNGCRQRGATALRSIPEVDSRDPLWTRPSLARRSGRRSTGCPAPRRRARDAGHQPARCAAEALLIVLPGDSWRPLSRRLAPPGFFLLLTVKMAAAGVRLRRDRGRCDDRSGCGRPTPRLRVRR